VDGERRGVSRFTLDDARKAQLIKESAKAAWNTSPRNMLLARAMSNGVKWFVPEVMGGLPVYTPGEIPTQPELTAGTGTDSDEGSGVDLGPRVEKVIARAEEQGHRGLSNRAAVELAVGNRAPGVVNDWVRRATEELDRHKAEKDAAAESRVEEDQEPAEVEVEAPPEEVTAEPVPEEETPDEDPEIQALRARYERLEGMDEEALSDEDRDALHAEIDVVQGKLREKGVEV